MQNETSKHKPIAVVGVSALFPGSNNAGGFWGDILAGTDMVKDIPKSHWLIEDYYDKDQSAKDKTYGRRGAFLDDVSFNPLEFGVPPNIVPATDTAQLLALIVAQQVLQDATGGQFATMDKDRVSVILGVTSAQELLGDMVSRLQKPIWQKSLREAGVPESKVVEVCERIADHYVPWQESTFPGLLGNVVAGRIANRLDLGGTNCVTDAACASTFSATLMAVNELSLGQSDLVITGGVDTMNDIFMYMCFSKTPALSATGDCRPFSDQADGTILGEGIGMVALKRLEDAERDGDRVYAVLRGIGASSDGRSKSVYAPVPEGQAKALRRAYEAAGYGPGTVELVEGHGTGTKAGDAAEFAGLKLAFGEADRDDHQWCSLGSVKSQIGHAKAAAGAAGLFKTVMSLHHKVLPPTIKIDQPNPKLELETSPFNLNTRPRPWVRASDHPRRASVSSFGFGGSNYHITFEEYLGDAPQAYRLRNLPTELVVLGAQTREELCAKLRDVKVGGNDFLPWFARKSQTELNQDAPAKVSIVATSDADLEQKLIQAAGFIEKTTETSLQTPTGIYYSLGAVAGEVGFLFPGQGSQYLNMGAELPMQWREAGIAWDQAADIHMEEGKALHQVVYPQSVFTDEAKQAQEAMLLSTQWAQPAIGVASLSQLGLLNTLGLKPTHVAGHSFGEITALYAAGSITVEEMIAVARKRGELMNEAASLPGAMIAVAATIETVKAALPKDSSVVVANHNAPEQVVLSGQVAGIEKATEVLKAAGLKVRALKVATAFHSEVVQDSVKPFAAFLEGIKLKKNSIPVYACSEASPYPKTAKAMRKVLSEQIIKPVRFVEQIEAMHAAGVRTFVEVGPSRVLTNLTKQILEGKEHTAINMDRKGKHAVTSFHHGLAQLVTAGVELNLEALWAAHELLEDPREVKKAAMELKLNGANYNKPYPPKEGAAGLPLPNPEITPEVVIKEVVKEIVREVPVHVAAPVATEYQEELVMKKEINVETNHPLTYTAPEIVPAVSGSDYAAWMQAFGMIQEQTVNAHAAFQKTMADTHMAFLQSAETTMVGLASVMGGASLPAVQPMVQTQALTHSVEVVAAPVAAPVYEAPLPAPVVSAPIAPAPVAVAAAAHTPVETVQAAPAPVAATPAPAPVAATPSTELDLHGLLLSVVAEKTGYPTEMLSMGMDLESDLGIDSIKRVEILSAITENAPNLPDIDPSAMADLKTLGQIVEHMGGSIVAAAPVTETPALVATTTTATSTDLDLQGLLLSVVAEKTGYPTEMLSMGMDLESDLGIDSIKRVEILSAITEQAPGLPDIDPSAMADLKTLGQIVEYMGGDVGAPTQAAAAPVVATASEGVDLTALLLEVVAEKTGYPTEMLSMGMDLESDLGIDSIKRVEILSAITEKVPGLPDIDPAAMADLKTLGQIVGHMQAGGDVSMIAADVQEAGGSDLGKSLIDRYILEAIEAPASGLTMHGFHEASHVSIVDEGKGVGAHLKAYLEDKGLKAEVVREVNTASDVVIFLGGLEDAGFENALGVNLEAFHAARVASAKLGTTGGVFITVQDTGGDFGLSGNSRAWLGGLTGLAKTAALEWQDASVRAIDIERGDRTAAQIGQALGDEIWLGGAELEVGLSKDGRRITLHSGQASVEGGEASLQAGDVVVASGGARGVTAATLIALAQKMPLKFVLLGRSELVQEPASCAGATTDAELKRVLLQETKAAGIMLKPADLGRQVRGILAGREIRQTVKDIEQAGGKAQYHVADIRDAKSLNSVLDTIRASWGPVKGIVHGAGVLADKFIKDKTDADFEKVYMTKVGGLQALLEATKSDPLSMICLFSSVAARGGNTGQCDYAMANEVLNKVAAWERTRRGGKCLVKSLNWGPWEGGMVTPALEAHFKAMGVPLIPLREGAQMLVDELLGSNPERVEIVMGADPREVGLSGIQEGHYARFEVSVSQGSHPYLKDHSIKNVPVLPVVMVLDWFTRAAKASRRDLHLQGCHNLKVLKGISLGDYVKGESFRIVVDHVGDPETATLSLKFLGRGDVVHYTATANLSKMATAGVVKAPVAELKPWNDAIYGDVLFHGPDFQVIQSVEGVSDAGGSAILSGVKQAGWKGHWETSDPAALDGGLQLALLWGKKVLGGATLPTGVGTYQVHRQELVDEPIHCTVNRTKVEKSKAICDIQFLSGEGQLLAELQGVETHLLPSKKSTQRS